MVSIKASPKAVEKELAIRLLRSTQMAFIMKNPNDRARIDEAYEKLEKTAQPKTIDESIALFSAELNKPQQKS